MADLWERVEALALRSPGVDQLRRHRLHLVAASARHRRGQPVPADLRTDARRAAASALAVPVLLERVRAACDEAIVVMKGPEAAAHYADPLVRPSRDLDLLVEDAAAVQRALLAAGFVPAGDPALYVGIHHLRPLALPGLPLTIEVHSRPKWPDRMAAPDAREVLEAARPGAVGVDGIGGPDPVQHAVLLAAHAWAHDPLGCAGRLVDVAAVLHEADLAEADALARRWGCRRLWRTTVAAVDGLLASGRRPIAMRAWARHLIGARERTVLESHATRLAGHMWGMPGRHVAPASASALAGTAGRSEGEPWARKLRRSRRAVADAFIAKSEHEARLERRRA